MTVISDEAFSGDVKILRSGTAAARVQLMTQNQAGSYLYGIDLEMAAKNVSDLSKYFYEGTEQSGIGDIII